MICRWWVLKMGGGQEQEEEMDERQEVELLASKGIPDLGFAETETCFWWLKLPLESIFDDYDAFGFFWWIIGREGSKTTHYWCQTVWGMLLTCQTDIYKQSSRMSDGGGRDPVLTALFPLPLNVGPSPRTRSSRGRRGPKARLFLHVDLCWHKENGCE